MGRIVLAVGGAIVGSFFGPLGTQIGFAVGSFLGGRLFGDQNVIEGPRLNDTNVQSGTFNTPIPRHYGTNRIAGSLIWVQGNKLIEVKEEKSAKGGGPKVVTYKYFATFAVALTTTESQEIKRVWANTKLLYDNGSEQLNQGALLVAALSNKGGALSDGRVYLGTEDQQPDPSIEAEKGIGNTPAFRGTTYLVFDFLALENHGNVIPNITAEVISKDAGTQSFQTKVLDDPGLITPSGSDYNGTPRFLEGALVVSENRSSHGSIVRYSLSKGNILMKRIFDGTQLDANGNAINVDETAITDGAGHVYCAYGDSTNSGPIYQFNAWTLQLRKTVGVPSSSLTDAPNLFGMNLTAVRNAGFKTWLVGQSLSSLIRLHEIKNTIQDIGMAPVDLNLTNEGLLDIRAGGDSVLDVITIYGGGSNVAVSRFKSVAIRNRSSATAPFDYEAQAVDENWTAVETFFGSDGPLNTMYWSDEDVLIVCGNTKIAKVDPTTRAVLASHTFTGATMDAIPAFRSGVPFAGLIWIPRESDQWTLFNLIKFTEVRTRDASVDWGHSTPTVNSTRAMIARINGLWAGVASGTAHPAGIIFLEPRATATNIPVKDIIDDISAEVGLGASDIDTTAVTATTRGVTYRKQTTARAMIEPLLAAYFIDAAHVDGKVVYTQRPKTSSQTIDADDLGANIDTAQLSEGQESRAQELDLPETISVGFIDRSANYDQNVADEQRSRDVVSTRETVRFDFPIVMSPQEARDIVQKLMYTAWSEHRTIDFQLPLKYASIAPGDVLTLPFNGVNHNIRIESVQENQFLQLKGRVQFNDAYTAVASAIDSQILIPTITASSESGLYFMDMPLLRDEDDSGGFYLAPFQVDPNDTWPGEVVFKSNDGEGFFEWDAFLKSAVWGSVEDELPSGRGGTVFDVNDSVDVFVVNGTLSSASELDVLNGSNIALVQAGEEWECIQWQDVVDNGGGNYTISNLLRGRRGTERLIDAHSPGDGLILLDNATGIFRRGSISERNLERFYKPITIGTTASLDSPIAFTNTSRGLQPYTVADVVGTRDGSENLTITWKRRTRLGGAWSDGTDVPLSEASERYEVDILSGSTVLRTIAVTAETASYTAAAQTTDGLTPGDPVTMNVYQLSDVVGRGFAKNATV